MLADGRARRGRRARRSDQRHRADRFRAARDRARSSWPAREHALELYWLDGYGGGLFVPFRDATSGAETYGGGRYLLDTVKGADLGGESGRLVLDFNFAYNPSCSYDPRWVCPLVPAREPAPARDPRRRADARRREPEVGLEPTAS